MSRSAPLPAGFARRMAEVHGAAGTEWVEALPDLVAAAADAWGLTLGHRFGLTYNYVVAARTAGGKRTVLKLGLPGTPELAREAAALAAYGGHGAVRLLDADPAAGALLLERALPGHRLSRLVPARDAEATLLLAGVLRRLWEAEPPAGLPPLASLADAFTAYLNRHGTAGPLPARLVSSAAALFDELCASAAEQVVLHGDLHHHNVLSARRAPWLAIDPHGCVGDPGYDVGAFLYNPTHRLRGTDVEQLVRARLSVLAPALRVDRDRLYAWGFVKAMLAEVWSVADHGRPHGLPLRVAKLLAPVRR